MHIRFWGVRGSIATPLTNAELEVKIETAVKLGIKAGITDDGQVPGFLESLPLHIRSTVGGDTACVEIQAGGKILILDAGTGLRRLGLDLIKRSGGNPIEAHILMTHTHWDHISGIPFFVPAFSSENNLTFYSPFPGLKERLARQQNSEYFPAPLSPTFRFVRLNEHKQFHIGDVKIEIFPLNHPGGSYSYRITYGDKTIVYATLMGAGDARVSSEAAIGLSEAKELKALFFGEVPELPALIKRLRGELKRTGRITLCDGSKIKVSSQHMVIPYLLQGDESRIMRKAAVIAFVESKRRGLDILKVGDIHDEWQNDCDAGSADEFMGVVCPMAFEQSGKFHNYSIPIECDTKKGLTWAETH